MENKVAKLSRTYRVLCYRTRQFSSLTLGILIRATRRLRRLISPALVLDRFYAAKPQMVIEHSTHPPKRPVRIEISDRCMPFVSGLVDRQQNKCRCCEV